METKIRCDVPLIGLECVIFGFWLRGHRILTATNLASDVGDDEANENQDTADNETDLCTGKTIGRSRIRRRIGPWLGQNERTLGDHRRILRWWTFRCFNRRKWRTFGRACRWRIADRIAHRDVPKPHFCMLKQGRISVKTTS